eukprot:SM000109S14131  [mRNA]  locus=s109:11457:13697:+ [translate_table: standard]
MVLLKLKQLESQLQAVQPFQHPKVDLEQYPTSAHISARMVHMMESSYNDVKGKVVVDLGCGCGMLGIAASLMGAEYVIGVDVDSDALLTCSENCTDLEVQMDLLQCPISSIALHGPVDTVVMNPPFGTRRKGADMEFLQSALKHGYKWLDMPCKLHISTTLDVQKIDQGVLFLDLSCHSLLQLYIRCTSLPHGRRAALRDLGAKSAEVLYELRFDLAASFAFHKSRQVDVAVDLWRFTVVRRWPGEPLGGKHI